LALAAAREAMAGRPAPPEAIFLGGTTGGILRTEEFLRRGVSDAAAYRWHGAGTIAEHLAEKFGCTGPVLTVSTACSSSAVAIKLALNYLWTGRARHVLAGGADSLCRLTYHGFASLQLIDPQRARPLDATRAGMTVAEGAAFLYLTAADAAPADAVAELVGGGLTCDAYHATAPEPHGAGIEAAMRRALAEAGASPDEVDYLNLHGTGTRDNDLAETAGVKAVFPTPPALSSTKGVFGHTLGAAGALEAVITALGIADGFLPPNVGFANPDPEIALTPVCQATPHAINVALSNSLGFGGNNATVVLRRPVTKASESPPRSLRPLGITRAVAVTRQGDATTSLNAWRQGESLAGMLPQAELAQHLSPQLTRRVRRLPLLVLNLAEQMVRGLDRSAWPQALVCGTAWGPVGETHEFLKKLFASNDQIRSPIDFAGSVHNAPASQAAILLGARGANITTSGGAGSFEHALLAAELIADDGDAPILLVGADETHPELSHLFDPSVAAGEPRSDGGGALLLTPDLEAAAASIELLWYRRADSDRAINELADALAREGDLASRFRAIFVGARRSERELTARQCDLFLRRTGFRGPVIDYRTRLGEYATAAATATALIARSLIDGTGLSPFLPANVAPTAGQGALLLGFGRYLTAVAVVPRGKAD
jgi:3-oxoacyl-(acyl-carrier-protein) synthase